MLKFLRHRLKKDTSGFTLVELLVAFAVFTVLVLVMTPVFKQGTDFWETTQSQVEIRQSLNSAMEFMTKELRRSGSRSVVTGANESIVAYNVYNDPKTYSFTLDPQEKNPQIHVINFRAGSSAPITLTSASVDVTEVVIDSPSGNDQSYEIKITGRYVGRNAIKDGSKKLTIKTRFTPRV